MEPAPGAGDVLVLDYKYTGPFIDAYSAYDLYMQVDPELIVNGQELLIPSEGVKPFLIKTCGYPPRLCCMADVKGLIRFLEVTGGNLKASLEASETDGENPWKYSGVVNYKLAPLGIRTTIPTPTP